MAASPSFVDIESTIPTHVTIPAYRASRASKDHPMHRTSALLAVLTMIIVAVAFALTASMASASTGRLSACQEDASCWSWPTMGDRKRGVATLHGNVRVVGPCTFQRWMRSGRIAYSITVDGVRYPELTRMRGDAWALRYGCGFDVQDY